MSEVHVIPSVKRAWVDYCIKRDDVATVDYLSGYQLLEGPHAAEWLARGFPELLRAVRNSRTGS